jgi:hypothetical protein
MCGDKQYIWIGVGVAVAAKLILGYDTMQAVEIGSVVSGVKYLYDGYVPVLPPAGEFVGDMNAKKCGCGH